MDHPTDEDEAADGKALTDQVDALARNSSFIVIDTPGRNSYLGRLALSMADIVVTPLNDSFIDLDVLGTVDPKTLAVTGTSHYFQVGKRHASNANFVIMSALIGSCCGIAFRCLVHVTLVSWAKDCKSFHDDSIFAALKDWPSE
jgi:hypothetical protein